MKQLIFFVCLTFLFSTNLIAQQKPTPIFIGPDAPEWFQLLQDPEPNVFRVKEAFEDYYSVNKFIKTKYTNYYKRWMIWARRFTEANGRIYIPTPEEDAQREAKLLADRAASQPVFDRNGNPPPPTWSYIGPKQTYDTDGTTEVTWQTNIYSIDVAPSDANVLVAGGETGGLFRTTDKGLTWNPLTHTISHGAFGAVKIHPTDPLTFYAATDGKIIKSINGGTSFTTVYTESNLWVNEFAISAADPNIIIAASDGGLIRSINGGTSWTKLFTNQVWTIKQKVGDGTTFFLVRLNGTSMDFMKSTDSGANWTASNSGLYSPISGEAVTGAIIAVCPTNAAQIYIDVCGSGSNLSGFIGVFKSTNTGSSWTNTNPSNAIGNSPIPYSTPAHVNLMTSGGGYNQLEQGFYDMAFIVNPNNANQLIAGGTSWWKSTDGGATWNGIGGYAGGLPWAHPDIQCAAAIGNDTWISSDGGVNYSTDFFTTMLPRMNGITGIDLWGFDSGWNEDILVGGRYHNGNMGYHQTFPANKYYRLGGGEAATGYVSPGRERKAYFSDIGGKIFKGGFTGGVQNFTFNEQPNESYAYYAISELAFHPQSYNIVFCGTGNKLRKSTDGGSSFTDFYTFPGTSSNEVYEVEICRSNPQVMYCSQWDGTDDAIWRSSDGGVSFTLCTALPLPNNNDRVKLAASATNANTLWVAVTYGSNGKKIYKSTDGGQSWVNLTTSVLDGYKITDILPEHGTNGGIYLGCNGAVFYRNNSLSNWQNYSDGLPLGIWPVRLKPFYRDDKLRIGSYYFGVWEAPFYETHSTLVNAMVDKLTSQCARDTFYFDDYSVVNHTGTSWAWSFPGAAYVSSTSIRTPKVVYGNAGNYQAFMTLTTTNGTFLDTLNIVVGNACAADSLPGRALSLPQATAGTPDYAVTPIGLGVTTNTMTISCWVRPTGIQPDYAGIVFSDNGGASGLDFRSNNQIGYHWNDGGYSYNYNGGATVPANQWSYLAMVISPNSTTLYVNGVGATQTGITNAAVNFINGFQIGRDRGYTTRVFKGLIDEVCIWNRSLSQNEIREQMHLRKIPTNDATLLSYYQFNETSGLIYDRAGIAHASLVNAAGRVKSTVPIGPGVSQRLNATTAGLVNFNIPAVKMTFPASGPYPNGELCVTRLHILPDTIPETYIAGDRYWIVNNYGTNATFNSITSFKMEAVPGISNADAQTPSLFHLYKRPTWGEGFTWGSILDNADVVTSTNNIGAIEFSTGLSLTSFSQFIIGRAAPLPIELSEFRAAAEGKNARLNWTSLTEKNLNGFAVERSLDAVSWKEISFVKAKGASNYSFIDIEPGVGKTWLYRLKMNDFDGKTSLSTIRSVRFDGEPTALQVFPNPLRNEASIEFSATQKMDLTIEINDAAGRLCRSIEWRVGAGLNRIEQGFDELANGVYVVSIKDKNAAILKSIKIVKN